MSQTTNLGLFKHDNPATNTNAFDYKEVNSVNAITESGEIESKTFEWDSTI